MKQQQHIEIVRSSISSLSSMGDKSCEMIRAVLSEHYEQVGVTLINNITDLEKLVAQQPDLVFLGMKYVPLITTDGLSPDTKVWLAGYLEAHGINYTGSPAAAIALDFDKAAAKRAVEAAGLLTASFFMAQPGQYRAISDLPLPFPIFVKPPAAGGGKGISADSVVRDFAGFERQVQLIHDKFQTAALVETFLPGREFSVAILGSLESQALKAMPLELLTEQNENGDRILGENIKAADTEQLIAVPDAQMKQAVSVMALTIFQALGARDYGRVDIRLDGEGVPHFLEANLIPGVAQHDFTSYFTAACLLNESMKYETMILRIVELGLSHSFEVALDDLGSPSLGTPALFVKD